MPPVDLDLAVRAVARALVLPPGGPLLLALAGISLLKRAPRIGRALALGGIAVTLLLSLPLIADPLTLLAERYPPLDLSRPVAADAIVVLGGGVRRDSVEGEAGMLMPIALQRLAAGANLARVTGLPLLLSGGVVDGGPPEAQVLERALERDFALKARWLESRSRTTRENARATAALLVPLGLRRVVLVTTASHMQRAAREFAAAGLTVVPAPVAGIGTLRLGLNAWLPHAAALERSHAALYEFAGELVADLDGGR
jgi:uncharacterized SAM-binding protein YcdF (DUF218 family)